MRLRVCLDDFKCFKSEDQHTKQPVLKPSETYAGTVGAISLTISIEFVVHKGKPTPIWRTLFYFT